MLTVSDVMSRVPQKRFSMLQIILIFHSTKQFLEASSSLSKFSHDILIPKLIVSKTN